MFAVVFNFIRTADTAARAVDVFGQFIFGGNDDIAVAGVFALGVAAFAVVETASNMVYNRVGKLMATPPRGPLRLQMGAFI